MEVQSVSRWDATPVESKSKIKLASVITACGAFVLLVIGIYVAAGADGTGHGIHTASNVAISDERAAISSAFVSKSDANLVENVAQLTLRVKALEYDNQRLSAELSNLLDHDGVIERLVTHIRALHAQSEATRRDVVDAIVGPLSGSDPAFDMHESDLTLPLEGMESPLLSKARHTIVTPVAAVSAEEEPKPATRPRSSVAKVEPDEGATN